MVLNWFQLFDSLLGHSNRSFIYRTVALDF